MLKFSTGNRKLNHLAHELGLKNNQVVGFDLPAGYTCPAADICQSFSDRESGKITDGDNCKFRCYAASIESAFTPTRRMHWHNYTQLMKLSTEQMVELILSSIPKAVKVIRIHSSGDFFTRKYFNAWVKVAEIRQDISFFGYTKVLPYVKAHKSDNFHLVYSFGGKMDSKVTSNIPVAYVVNTINDAILKGIPAVCIDNPADDYNMIMSGKTFANILHGTQPAKAR